LVIKNIPALAEYYRVYLVDLPGFGALRRRRFVLAEAASWLAAWMEAAGLDKTHLVGHSMGGYVCLGLATRGPEAVRCLVLVATAGIAAGRPLFGHHVPFLSMARCAVPSFLPILAHDVVRAGPVTLWRAARDLLAGDVRGDLRLVEAPALLVWGERDHLIPPSVETCCGRSSRSRSLLVLENAGHVPMFDRPQEFNAALLAFLAGEPVGE